MDICRAAAIVPAGSAECHDARPSAGAHVRIGWPSTWKLLSSASKCDIGRTFNNTCHARTDLAQTPNVRNSFFFVRDYNSRIGMAIGNDPTKSRNRNAYKGTSKRQNGYSDDVQLAH